MPKTTQINTPKYKSYTETEPDKDERDQIGDSTTINLADWVALRPIFEVYAKETGYKGGGKLREPWWRQVAAEQQMEATLKNISAEVG